MADLVLIQKILQTAIDDPTGPEHTAYYILYDAITEVLELLKDDNG